MALIEAQEEQHRSQKVDACKQAWSEQKQFNSKKLLSDAKFYRLL